MVLGARVEAWIRFKSLAQEWKAQSRAISSITDEAMSLPIRKLLAWARKLFRFFCDNFRTKVAEPNQWFWALRAITRVSPVDDADRGDYVRMARAWLEWGVRERYGW